jgi:hypothetical protein
MAVMSSIKFSFFWVDVHGVSLSARVSQQKSEFFSQNFPVIQCRFRVKTGRSWRN